MYDSESQRLNISAGLASVGVASVLVLLKLWALWQTGAISIGASLADSAMDLLISSLGLVTILYAARPADHDHTFGHSSAEDLVSLGQAIFIAVSAGLIIWTASRRLMAPDADHISSEGVGIVVMVTSVCLTLALVFWQSRVAKRTGNKVVSADMLHYLGDLLPTMGAIFALWAAKALGWQRLDSIVALLAAAIMLRGAWKIGAGGWNALMDAAAEPEIVTGLGQTVAEYPGVRAYHDLKTRTAGNQLFVQVHIELDGDQPLTEAHDIAAGLKQALICAHPNADVIIHKDVWHGASDHTQA